MAGLQYFDTIPNDALHNVIRFLAKNPCSERWMTEIKAEDVVSVVDCTSSISVAARELFTSVINSYNEKVGSRFNSLMFTTKPEFDEILNKLASNVTHFHFPDNQERVCYKELEQLRVLKIDEEPRATHVGQILRTSQSSLRELYLDRNNLEMSIIHSVREHCESIEKLSLVYRKSIIPLEPMWATIGQSLKEVCFGGSVKDYSAIARHCSNLDRLQLLNFHETWTENIDEFASLLNSCVLDLHFELWDEFDPYSVDELSAVFALFIHSHTVQMHVVSARYDQCVSFLRAKGSNIRVLSVHCGEEELPSDVGESLSSLEKLTLFQRTRGDAHALARSIFENPLPKLRKLVVYTAINGRLLLSDVAHSVTTLEEFECYDLFSKDSQDSDTIHIKAQDFDKLLRANRRLRRIQIRNFHRYSGNGWKIANEMAELIRQIRYYKSIEEVDIVDRVLKSGYRLLHDACVPLRSRRLNIVVNSVRLLPTSGHVLVPK